MVPEASRPRVPPRLARELDRLARRAHAFHRFAHHPLCGRYEGELVRLGRKARVCRGCLFALAGGVAGIALGVALRPGVAPALAAVGLALAVAAATRLARPPKALSRLLPMVALGFALPTALAPASLAVFAGYLALYRRRGPNRAPCTSCPERDAQPCSGLRPLVRRERAFQRLAGRLLSQALGGAPRLG